MSPPRSDAKPMLPPRRAPVSPSRAWTASASSDLPRAAATTSPICSAVPLGASTLSAVVGLDDLDVVALGRAAVAATSSSFITTLTPTLMFGAMTIAICSAWPAISAFCGGVEAGGADDRGDAELAAEGQVRQRALGAG